MSQGKVKLYKNSERNSDAVYKPYVPQYQILGIEPEEHKSATLPAGALVSQGSDVNPRDKKNVIRQDMPEKTLMSKSSIPNVGHSRDYTWSGVDNEIVNDLEDVEVMSSMIDNNDYMSDQALGLNSSNSSNSSNVTSEVSDVSQIPEEEYALIVNNTIVCCGDLKMVEGQVKDLVFGEHPLCGGDPIPVQELIVLKRVAIKIGVFLG